MSFDTAVSFHNYATDTEINDSIAKEENSAKQPGLSAIFCPRPKKRKQKAQRSYRLQKRGARPNSSAIPSYNLCEPCLSNIWGEAGWKKLWNRLTRAPAGAIRSETWWEDSPSDEMTMDYEVTGEALKRSSDNLCCWCALLVGSLRTYPRDDNGFPVETDEGPVDPGANPKGVFEIKLKFRGPPCVQPFRFNQLEVDVIGPRRPERAWAFLKFRAFVHNNGPAAQHFFTVPRVNPLSDFSRLGAPVVWEWTRNCLDHHQSCSGLEHHTRLGDSSTPQLPTRILDVAPLTDPSLVSLHLSRKDEHEQYLILSYRWGAGNHTLLTMESLQALQDGIALEDLPATLQDAVKITRAMGIKFLWVDALCIVQDSEVDVCHELGRMQQYYRNALLTIQPSGLSGAEEHFLDSKDSNTMAPSLDFSDRVHRVLQIPFFSQLGEHDKIILDTRAKFYLPKDEPIHSRGWVLQERLLSPRVLIFPSSGGFILQCDETERSYGEVFYFMSHVAWGRYRFPKIQVTSPSEEKSPTEPATSQEIAEQLQIAWQDMLLDYGSRSLTNPNDKLAAIAAIAEYLFDHYGHILGKYCAGHWRNFLMYGLGWSVGWGSAKPAPQPPRGPSWSFAAVEGAWYNGRGSMLDSQGDIEVLDCTTVPKYPSLPFGPVISGQLTLKGPLLSSLFWGPDGYDSDTLYLYSSPTDATQLGRAYPDTIENCPLSPIAVHLLLVTPKNKDSPKALVLLHVKDTVFRRVGVVDHWWTDALPPKDCPAQVVIIE